jgi:hypothetical protein
MNRKNVRAFVQNHPIVCPLCSSQHFHAKEFKVETTFLQIMEWEVFGDTGVMLVCTRCTRIQHFANRNAVVVSG